MRTNPNTPSFYPALVILALFIMGGCFFNPDFDGGAKSGMGKDAKFRKGAKSAEEIFREVLP